MRQSYLSVSNLSVQLGKRLVLDDVSLQVEKGQFWGILGPNGSGKTTFLRTIGGWLPPLSGEVLLEGRPLHELPRRSIAQKVGMVAVEEVSNAFTVEETVFMGRFAYLGRFGQASEDDKARVHEAMQQVGIFDKRKRLLTQLSQGERQKVWVARALAQDVSLLLLDEPTSHLDVKSQSEVFSLLEELCEQGKLAVIAILHDINLAMAFSSHLFFLQQGKLRAAGLKKEVLERSKLAELYEIPFELNVDDEGEFWARICYRRKGV